MPLVRDGVADAEPWPFDDPISLYADSPEREWRWLRAKGLVYRDDSGAPVRFDGVTIDISQQKELEAQREFLL